jgi:hypothetical protein
MEVYVIIKDDEGNLHQAVMDESKSIIISNLVKVYPYSKMTVDFIDNVVLKLSEKMK